MVPWWNRERTFQSKFVCHSPKKLLDDWRCTENRNFACFALLETEPGKGINLVGTYSFRCGKENVRFKK